MPKRWWIYPLFAVGTVLVAALLLVGYAAAIVYPMLPSLEALTEYNPKIPLRIYSAEGTLIGEFGEERRAVVKIADVPETLKQAILAAEDERFYEHGGVDYIGVLRAALHNFTAGSARQGASTITMQVARNFFLTKEKTLTRKFNEALLAFKIEHSLTKDQILEIYINQIYLGQRAYGFASAAQVYFGKNLRDLNLGEIAMLAGLPKAPSRYNPVVNLQRAKDRELYVLRRMRELDFINPARFEEASHKAVIVVHDQPAFSTRADYFSEMVRQSMYERYQDEAYTRGFRVYTTLSKMQQDAAYAAVRKGVMDYDKRHGYRGAEGYFALPQSVSEDALEDALQEQSETDDIYPALVLEADARALKVYRKGGEIIEITGEGLKFAQTMIGPKAPNNRKIRRGALIRVQQDESGKWQIVQLPQVEAALVAMDPNNGAIRALVGGFDFYRNKFNHAAQAYRQPGSSFKPFIYSAALEKGFTAATVINDAPLVIDAAETGSVPWEPKNFDATFDGPIRLRTALTKSKNLVSIRILQAITPQYAQDYISRFGFDPKQHPPYLTMALGAGSVTPLEMATGYSVFANGGYKIAPYFITRIDDATGRVLAKASPVRAAEGAQRSIDSRNAFVMYNIMQDVIRGGTGARAMSLGRTDLAGKTGTTNDQMDAWFAGFQRNLTCVVWVGFDLPRSLGPNETGAVAALPIWISFIGAVLKTLPEDSPPVPEGVIAARINPETGLRESNGKNTIVEYFYQENLPPEEETPTGSEVQSEPRRPEDIKNEIY
ncbi:MAG TPA: penicillin-binding protein 1A [Burkholderiales bacterium]|nr:penicillin-binding protein 1A [Burkholderiales bacterium]